MVDRINRMHGSETMAIGAQQCTRKDGKGKADAFANATKHFPQAQEPNDPLERRYRTKMKTSKQWNQRRLLYSSGQYG